MSVAFILNPGYNTINNVHHTFWDQQGNAIANSSLTQALEVETSVSAPSHVITGGTDPAQFYMLDATTLATDAPIFKAPVLQAPTAFSDLVGEFTTDGGVSFQNDIHMTYDAVAHDIDGVGTLTCDTLKYTTLDPAITPDIPSAWSSYPALSNVDLNNNRLVNTGSNTVDIITPSLKVQNAAEGEASAPTQVLVYSQSDNAETTAQLQLYAGNSTIAIGTLTQCPTTATGGLFPEYSSFGTDSAALRLAGSAGDIAIMPCNQFQANTGKIRLCYNQGLSAVSLNTLGALAFNSDWAAGVPVDGDYGTSGQIIQSNGDAAPPSWVAAPSASNWSEYPATERVDLASYGLKSSSTTVDFNSGLSLTGNYTDIYSGSSSNAGDDNNTVIIAIGTNAQTYSQMRMQCNSGLSSSKSASGFQYLAGSGILSSANTRDIVLQSGDYGIENTRNIRFAYDGSSKAYTINPSGALAFNANWNGTDPIIEGSYGTSGQLIQSNGSSAPPSWIAAPISGRYVLYVATDGLDANAGDITHPKLTIQSAINTATALYPQQVVILVQPGVYSGALSITRPNITLLGLSPSSQQNLLTQIAGNISIACTASQDLYYSQICIANLLVSGSIIDTSSVVHTLNIEACRIAANGNVFAQTSSADNRTRLVKCTLLQASLTADVNPMMLFSSGSILLNQLDVTAKNNCNLVKFNGTAILPTCALCTFTSDSASTVAEPIVLLAPTDGANKPFTFGYNAFIYSSYAPKLSHPESAGICVSSTTGRPYITVAYNSFALAGTDATGYAIYDSGYNTSTAGYYFFFSNNGGVNPAGINAVIPLLTDFAPQAHHIYGFSGGGSQNKFTLSAVA